MIDTDVTTFSIDCFEELAHELRQPLSAIESLAFHLELTAADEKTRSSARQIQAMVSKAHETLNSGVPDHSGPAFAAIAGATRTGRDVS